MVSALLLVFTLMLADFFDTMGTVVGVGAEGDLLDEDGRAARGHGCSSSTRWPRPPAGRRRRRRTPPTSSRPSGVADGARTGLASVVTGVLFLGALFLTPLIAIVPYEAASPALVVVGFLLMTRVKDIPWDDYDLAIPAFLTIVLMPFTFSITNGIGAGFVSYGVIKLVRGKAREVHPLLWVVAALFVVYFAIEWVERLLGRELASSRGASLAGLEAPPADAVGLDREPGALGRGHQAPVADSEDLELPVAVDGDGDIGLARQPGHQVVADEAGVEVPEGVGVGGGDPL